MHPIFAAFTAGLGLALLYGTLLAAQVPDIFATAKADVWLSANNGDDANDGLAPEKAVKTIGRAYAAAKAAVDEKTLDGTRQIVVAVDEGEYGSVQLNCELTAGIAFRAVGARERTLIVPSNDPGDEANQTPMSCDNGVYPRVFEMEGFTITRFNGRHHTDINWDSHQRGIVYGMTLRRCLITENNPICTKAFVCGTFIDCDITRNTTRPTPQNVGGDAPFGGYGAVYYDLAYMTRMFNCHVWDNDFSSFHYFAKKLEASHCLFENSFAAAMSIADSYGGHDNTMIAERYTNPNFTYSDTYKQFFKIGVKYYAVIASSEDCATQPFYTTNTEYTVVQNAVIEETRTTCVPVPYNWLRQHLSLGASTFARSAETPLATIDKSTFESAAKLLGANGYRLWESYAFGLEPNDESEKLRITALPIKADGTPDIDNISFSPSRDKWNVGNASPVVKGTESLSNGNWQPVTDENRSSLRFFKVEVEFP